MPIKLNVDELSKEQRLKLFSVIRDRIYKGLDHKELDWVREMIDLAVHQQYEYTDFARDTLTNESDDSAKAEILAIQETEAQDSDEFSKLKVPLLYKLHRGWVTYIKNAVFPSNGDWIEINRENHPVLDELGLNDFLPQANEAWVKILKTENRKFQLRQKYASGIAEYAAYGTTGCMHYYNEEEKYVDVRFPGITNFGIYPLNDRWRESTLILQYDVNYYDLKSRKDFDQDAIEKIRPADGDFTDSDPLDRGSQRNKEEHEYNTYDVPADKVRLWDIYFPILYIPGESEEEEVLLEKVAFTVALNPVLAKSYVESGDEIETDFILKGRTDVDRFDHGINLVNFGETLPGVFYHKGPLIPFIPDQLQLNQLKSGSSRVTAMLCDPPLALKRVDGDYEQTPPERLEPGAVYEGYEVTSLAPAEYSQVIQQFREYYKYLTEEVEEATGMSKTQLGSSLPGRRSATEIREFSSGGAAAVSEAAGIYDEELLRPSLMNRIQLTQRILVNQIEAKLEQTVEIDPTASEDTPEGERIPTADAYNKALAKNALFKRLKVYSGIEKAYKEFKKSVEQKILEDQAIITELEAMMTEIIQLNQFANSPIPPFIPPPIPLEAIQAGQPSGAQMAQMYVQQEEEKRKQAKEQAKQMMLQVQVKKMQLTGTEPVPELSDYLIYEILTADIDDSDLDVTGSKSALSKEMALKAVTTILEAGAKIPQIGSELNYKTLVGDLAKAVGKSAAEVTKSLSQKAREQEQIRQQQAQLQQQELQQQQQQQQQ